MSKIKHLTRWKEWGDSKIPFIILAWLVASLQLHDETSNWTALIYIMIFSITYLSFGYMFNDWMDSDSDKRAGKTKLIHSLPKWQVWLILSTLIITGIIFMLPWVTKLATVITLSFCYFFAVTYSAPPLRFKEKAEWGLLIGSVSQRTLLAALVFIVMDQLNWIATLFLAITIVTGFRWILIHQIEDYERDLAAGVYTFTTHYGIKQSEKLLIWLFNFEIVLLFFFALSLNFVQIWIIYCLYIVVTIVLSIGYSNTPWQMLRTPSTAYIVLADFYFLYWPLGLAIMYASYQPLSWLLIIFLLILLLNHVKQHISALAFLIRRPMTSRS